MTLNVVSNIKESANFTRVEVRGSFPIFWIVTGLSMQATTDSKNTT